MSIGKSPPQMFVANHPVDRVFKFNREVVGVEELAHPQVLSVEESDWLHSALAEEVKEFDDGKGNLVEQVDACIDAAIFALGGLCRMGLTEDQARRCFDAVMDANFAKKAGVKGGRSGAKDAVKPEGWIPPEERIWFILRDLGEPV